MISWRIRYFFIQPGNIIKTIFTIGQKVEDVFFGFGSRCSETIIFCLAKMRNN
jgi:hypothetical protein